MLSSDLAELVDGSTVEKNLTNKGVKKKDEDESEIQEEMQMSSDGEGVKNQVFKTASDLGASGKEVQLGQNEEPEEGVTEALLVLEKVRQRRKLLWRM